MGTRAPGSATAAGARRGRRSSRGSGPGGFGGAWCRWEALGEEVRRASAGTPPPPSLDGRVPRSRRRLHSLGTKCRHQRPTSRSRRSPTGCSTTRRAPSRRRCATCAIESSQTNNCLARPAATAGTPLTLLTPSAAAQGASPDMKRFLFAQEQLAAQGKARIRQWPKNKGGCASPATHAHPAPEPPGPRAPRACVLTAAPSDATLAQVPALAGAGRQAPGTDPRQVLEKGAQARGARPRGRPWRVEGRLLCELGSFWCVCILPVERSCPRYLDGKQGNNEVKVRGEVCGVVALRATAPKHPKQAKVGASMVDRG